MALVIEDLADWLTGWEWLGRDSQENVMVDIAYEEVHVEVI